MSAPKKLPGRPKKPDGEKYKTTARMFGRIPDDEWAEIKAGIDAGMTFTEWAKAILLKHVRRKRK